MHFRTCQTQALQRSSGIASVFLLTDADEHEKSFFSTHIPQLHIANAGWLRLLPTCVLCDVLGCAIDGADRACGAAADSGLSEAMIAVVDQAVAAEATRWVHALLWA
eukprot:791039-Rhodomonas_salina.1